MDKLRSSFLGSVRPFYAPDDDKGKSPAQIERDKIKVEVSKKADVDVKEPDKEDDKESIKAGEDADDESDESGESDDDKTEKDEEDKEDKDEKKELTLEDYKKELEAAQKKVARLERRTGKTAGERDQLKKDLAAAKVQLDAKVEEGSGLDEAEVDRRANLKAGEIAANAEFSKAVQKLVRSAAKVDAKVEAKLTEMGQDISPIPGMMIGILEDLDNENGGAVLAHLANNQDLYEEIWDLPLAKLSNRLNRISDKLVEDAKVKLKPKSKVPAPIEPIKGATESPSILPTDPTKNMAKFVQQRNIDVENRRKKRLGLA